MSEIAQIITAMAALVGAIGGVVLAVAKLGPFMTALNKMLADQHKRAIEAKKSAPIQIPVSTSPSQDVQLFDRRSLGVSLFLMAVSLIIIVVVAFPGGPASSWTVASCALCSTTIIIVVLTLVAQFVGKCMLALAIALVQGASPQSTQS
jgi:hypothetical protein